MPLAFSVGSMVRQGVPPYVWRIFRDDALSTTHQMILVVAGKPRSALAARSAASPAAFTLGSG
jgi:hypothetical protein